MAFPQRTPARPPGGHSPFDPDVPAPPGGEGAEPPDEPAHPSPFPVAYVPNQAPGTSVYSLGPARGAGGRSVPAVRRPASPVAWPEGVWPRGAAEEEPLVDVGQLRALLGFPWRAVRRHRRLAGGVFAAVCAAALLALAVAPRRYDVESTIVAQRNFVMPALGNPRRSVPAESDAPTRQAYETILNRANLLALIQETGLEEAWPRLQSPAGRAKSALRTLVRGPLSADEQRNQLVGYLGRQIWVNADEGTVHIGIHFPDPVFALRLVQGAQRNFIQARHASEVALIRESIGILEAHVATAHEQIDSALGDVRQFTPAAPPPVFASAGGVRRAARRSPALASLETELAAKRGALAAAEAARAQQTGATQARLATLRTTLGPAHPEVVAAQQALAALGTEAPEVTALRAAERDLAARVAAAGGGADAEPRAERSEPSLTTAALARLAAPSADTLEDPRLTYARSRLKIAVADYEDLLDRLESARIELETARAAFKYRYNVISPGLLPTRPSKPNVPLVLVGGPMVALFLAVFGAVAMDVAGGRLVEAWQVARFVGLPVLGEAPRP